MQGCVWDDIRVWGFACAWYVGFEDDIPYSIYRIACGMIYWHRVWVHGMLCGDALDVVWRCGDAGMVCRRHSMWLTAGWAEALPVERDAYQDATPCGLHFTSKFTR